MHHNNVSTDMVTLAITTWNRDSLTFNSFRHVLEDDRISEIVIVDDCSDQRIYDNLLNMVRGLAKVKIYRNEKNLGCYHNKRRAVELSANDWVILFDSDNIIKPDYLDALFEWENHWNIYTIYAPSFAKPHFDYRQFKHIYKDNLHENINIKNFDCMMNTCNFFVNKKTYIDVFDQEIEEPWTADTLYFNYCWLMRDYDILIVEGMEYEHLVHDGSHYKANVRKTGNLANDIMNKLRSL